MGMSKPPSALCVRLGMTKRGILAVDFWRIKTAIPAYQALLSAAWNHDHQWVIAAAGSRRTLGAMFRYAGFPLPPDLPDMVPVWRGTSGVTKKQAIRGYSWTVDRNVACWFAMRHAKYYGKSLVLAANVSKVAIVHYGNERNEKEVVIFDRLNAWVDGAVDEWELAFRRWEGAKKAEE